MPCFHAISPQSMAAFTLRIRGLPGMACHHQAEIQGAVGNVPLYGRSADPGFQFDLHKHHLARALRHEAEVNSDGHLPSQRVALHSFLILPIPRLFELVAGGVTGEVKVLCGDGVLVELEGYHSQITQEETHLLCPP
eukprot:CAMPEP_0177764352 /NCGR_PEP_ID=MMETSP0491_2-20121128/7357_1 /TAXON_ID=63592 /ORGANISM="Tetraselmis chuii, Strain PLY429" /LENGTH=136 /DNA_ID=CAMNT_0019280517 /DNA_START=181 /DNA_END=588 /DNA_ORIENTATION=+